MLDVRIGDANGDIDMDTAKRKAKGERRKAKGNGKDKGSTLINACHVNAAVMSTLCTTCLLSELVTTKQQQQNTVGNRCQIIQ